MALSQVEQKILADSLVMSDAMQFCGPWSFTYRQGKSVVNASSVTTQNLVLNAAPQLNDLVCVLVDLNVPVTNMAVKDGNNNVYTVIQVTTSLYVAYLASAPSNASATITASWTTAARIVLQADNFAVSGGTAFLCNINPVNSSGTGSTAAFNTVPGMQQALGWAFIQASNAVNSPSAGGTSGGWTGGAGNAASGQDAGTEYIITDTAIQNSSFGFSASSNWVGGMLSFAIKVPCSPIVQAAVGNSNGSNVSSETASFANSPTQGHLLLCIGEYFNSGQATKPTITIKDANSNVFTMTANSPSPYIAAEGMGWIAWLNCPSNFANPVTVSFGNAGATVFRIIETNLVGYSFDNDASSNGNTASSGNITTPSFSAGGPDFVVQFVTPSGGNLMANGPWMLTPEGIQSDGASCSFQTLAGAGTVAVSYQDTLASDTYTANIAGFNISSGLTENLSDTMTMSEGVILGYGGAITETLTINDSMILGYGLIIPGDQMVMSDGTIVVLGLNEIFAETMTMSDSLAGIGYGNSIVDQLIMSDSAILGYGAGITETLTISDQLGLGYGFIIADQMTMSDAVVEQLSIALNVSDNEGPNWADALGVGYGNAETDTLTMSDSLGVGYGEGVLTETMTISDAMSLGYGLLIADQMTMSDSEVIVLGETLNISEQLVISDTMGLGYGLSIADQLSMSDAVVIGFGEGITETMTITDFMGLGYGLLIADQMVMSDNFAFNLSTGGLLTENLSDTLTMSDALTVGYGNQMVESLDFIDAMSFGYGDIIHDQMTMSDSTSIVLQMDLTFSDTMTMSDATTFIDGMLIQIADATPGMLDALNSLYVYLLQCSDAGQMQDQLMTCYGLIIGTESMSMVDSLNENLILPLTLALADDGEANWMEAVILTHAFAPGNVVLGSAAILQRVVGNAIIQNRIQAALTSIQQRVTIAEGNVLIPSVGQTSSLEED